MGDRVFFVAERAIWTSDGTEEGTIRLKELGLIDELTDLNGHLVFTADDGIHGRELWTSDGTVEGTVMVADLRPGPTRSQPSDLTPVNGQLFFTADDGFHGRELWVYTPDEPAPLPGDVDLNGEVDFSDFVILADHFGQSSATWANGDLDEDGKVDFSDFVILANNFGRRREPTPLPSSAAQPASATLRSSIASGALEPDAATAAFADKTERESWIDPIG